MPVAQRLARGPMVGLWLLMLLFAAPRPPAAADRLADGSPSSAEEYLDVQLQLTPAGRLSHSTAALREQQLDLTARLYRPAPSSQHTERSTGDAFRVEVDLTSLNLSPAELPANTLWQVQATAPGFWFSPRTWTTEQSPLQLDAYPTASLLGSLSVPAGETLPAILRLHFQPAPQPAPQAAPQPEPASVPTGEVDCAVTAPPEVTTPRFRCELPAGVQDLRLRADRFVSHYRWGVRLAAGRRIDLGTFALQPGASVVGWVTAAQDTSTAQAGFAPERCQVLLTPQLGGWADAETRERQGALDLSAKVNERGFFSFEGVAPGQYRLAAMHPGFATARLAPVTVLERSETEILGLELQPPATLDILLTPPTDPFGAPWTLVLSQNSPVPGHATEVHSRSASSDGELRFEDLEPSTYSIAVTDGRGSHWHQRDVELHSGEQTIDVFLPRRRVAGTLWLGEEPLAADLWFGGFHGAERIGIRSNEEGRFYIFLPADRDRFRQVDIQAPHADVWVTLEDVEIPEAAAGADWPELELRLPDTLLAGEVVDPDNKPAPDAKIDVSGTRQVSATADGTFRLRGLEPGPHGVQARAHRDGHSLRSDYLEVHVHEVAGTSQAPDTLRLVLQPDAQLEGLVLDPSGRGIPGASIVATFTTPATSSAVPHGGNSEAHTDVDGVFALDLPLSLQHLDLFVFPPGFAAQVLRLSLPLTEPLVVTAEAAGGTLTVSYDAEAAEDRGGFLRRATTIEFDGRPLAHWWALSTWAEVQGIQQPAAGLILPGLQSGPYRVCLYDRPEPGGSESAADCAEGWLAPYGELAVTLREPE